MKTNMIIEKKYKCKKIRKKQKENLQFDKMQNIFKHISQQRLINKINLSSLQVNPLSLKFIVNFKQG